MTSQSRNLSPHHLFTRSLATLKLLFTHMIKASPLGCTASALRMRHFSPSHDKHVDPTQLVSGLRNFSSGLRDPRHIALPAHMEPPFASSLLSERQASVVPPMPLQADRPCLAEAASSSGLSPACTRMRRSCRRSDSMPQAMMKPASTRGVLRGMPRIRLADA